MMHFDQQDSVLIGQNINSNNVTTQVHIHQHPAASPLLPPLLRCPLPSQNFTGRAAELTKMKRFFFSNKLPRGAPRFLLIGMGGCGKSQIAFHFIHNYILRMKKFDDSMVFFVDATTLTTLENSYIAIAKSKGIGDTAQAAIDWLSNSKMPSLLLIDNADDPKLSLRNHLPRSRHSFVLITTRLRNAGRIYGSGPNTFIDVDALPEEDAEELLMKTAGLEENQRGSVNILIKELYCHSLAVVQAGAGIRGLSLSVDKYISVFRQRRTSLMDGITDKVTAIDLDDYPLHVATAWLISYERLNGPAQKLFDICAHLHYTGIAEELFELASLKLPSYHPAFPLSPAEDTALTSLREMLSNFSNSEGSWDSIAFKGCVQDILSLSLLGYDETMKYYVHPLIHDGLRNVRPNHLPTAFLLTFAHRVDVNDDSFTTRIVAHAERVLSICDKSGIHPDIADSLGSMCIHSKQGETAEQLHRDAWTKCATKLGHDHQDSIRALATLAVTVSSRGRYEEAEAMEREVLEKRRKILGPDHPSTIRALANPALTVSSRGRDEEAEPMKREVLEKQRKILGPDHPDTIRALANLAATVSSRGRYEEAEAMEREVLEKRRKILGPDHPSTIRALANLAATVSSRGRDEEAEPMEREVLEKQRKILGPDHPDTIRALANLAHTLYHRSNFDEAEHLMSKSVDRSERVLGPSHPRTTERRDTLLRWRNDESERFTAKARRIQVLFHRLRGLLF